jgi:hypothetical protein
MPAGKPKDTRPERASTNERLRRECFEFGSALNIDSRIGDVDQHEFLPRGAVTF